MILVIAEHRDGRLNRATWEAIAGAQQLAEGAPVHVVIAGADVSGAATRISFFFEAMIPLSVA